MSIAHEYMDAPDAGLGELVIEGIELNQTEQRVVDLLGSGFSQQIVASTLGLSSSRISQIVARDEVKALVSAKRAAKLQEASDRDTLADEIEDKLLLKIHKSVDRVHDPMQMVKMYSVINGAKRRTSGSEHQGTAIANQTIVNLSLPAALVNKYTTDASSQVTHVGDKALMTLPSDQLKEAHNGIQEQLKNERESAERIEEQRLLETSAKGHNLGPEDI